MKVQIINKSHHLLPQYATIQSAGVDLRANLSEPVVLAPMQRALIPTGLYISLPAGYEAQVRPRSGLAIKCIILINLSQEDFVVNDGERVAQMVIARHEQAEWVEVETLDETDRGAGGFGHTGKQ